MQRTTIEELEQKLQDLNDEFDFVVCNHIEDEDYDEYSLQKNNEYRFVIENIKDEIKEVKRLIRELNGRRSRSVKGNS